MTWGTGPRSEWLNSRAKACRLSEKWMMKQPTCRLVRHAVSPGHPSLFLQKTTQPWDSFFPKPLYFCFFSFTDSLNKSLRVLSFRASPGSPPHCGAPLASSVTQLNLTSEGSFHPLHRHGRAYCVDHGSPTWWRKAAPLMTVKNHSQGRKKTEKKYGASPEV